MKRNNNKKALYESIMTSVAKEVKKVLNEDQNNSDFNSDFNVGDIVKVLDNKSAGQRAFVGKAGIIIKNNGSSYINNYGPTQVSYTIYFDNNSTMIITNDHLEKVEDANLAAKIKNSLKEKYYQNIKDFYVKKYNEAKEKADIIFN